MTTLTDTEAAMANKLLAAAMVIALIVGAVPVLCLVLGQPFANVIFSLWSR